jgi:3-dehydroquinate dehydratase/shikimate dehydrogenase
VACLSARPAAGSKALAGGVHGAEWLLVRADQTGDVSPSWLRTVAPGPLIYALRTRAQGGSADATDPLRAGRLGAAAAGYDLVELEAPHDLVPPVLAAVPRGRRLVCWRGESAGRAVLEERLRWLSGVEAAAYRLVVAARRVQDGLAPLEVLHGAGRDDVIAFADGEAGLWSRVLSPLLGAPLIFGGLDEGGADEPAVARLVRDFGLPDPGPVRMTFGIVGDPVAHSLSPRLHNACYRATGLPAMFLPLPAPAFGPFWDDLVAGGALDRLGLPLRGLTVASPHKERAATTSALPSPAARRAGSANLVYRRAGRWVAETSDPAGVIETLARRGIAPADRRAAVVGCGGSGRAIAAALAGAGAQVVLSNRGRLRGELAARRLRLPLVELSDFSPADFDLVVNATPVGRDGAELPFPCDDLPAGAVVVDLVYGERPTPLAAAAAARGAEVIDGYEVLLVQAARQFAKMTGRIVPVDLMAGPLGRRGGPRVPSGRVPCAAPSQDRPDRSPIGGVS